MQNETTLDRPANPPYQDRHDEELWQLARRRASFKTSAFAYISVNTLLVAVWYFTSGLDSYFWPVWPILGWGIGIATQYFYAYHGNELFSTQREFEKLKNKQSN